RVHMHRRLPPRAPAALPQTKTDADGDDVAVRCGFLEVSRRISKRLASKVDRPTALQSPAFAAFFTCAGRRIGVFHFELGKQARTANNGNSPQATQNHARSRFESAGAARHEKACRASRGRPRSRKTIAGNGRCEGVESNDPAPTQQQAENDGEAIEPSWK